MGLDLIESVNTQDTPERLTRDDYGRMAVGWGAGLLVSGILMWSLIAGDGVRAGTMIIGICVIFVFVMFGTPVFYRQIEEISEIGGIAIGVASICSILLGNLTAIETTGVIIGFSSLFDVLVWR